MFCAKFSAVGIYFRFLASLSSMKVMRQFGRMLDWAGQHPATALMILLTLWAAALAVRAKLTEHARFNRTFADAVWDWSQAEWAGKKSVEWNQTNIAGFDLVLIATNHASVHYRELGEWAQCVVDTRNAMASIKVAPGKVWKA